MHDLSTQQNMRMMRIMIMMLWSLSLLASLEQLVYKVDFWIKKYIYTISSWYRYWWEDCLKYLYSWNSIISIIIHCKEWENMHLFERIHHIIMYKVSLLYVSLKYQRGTMACIFALLMIMSYYFGKQEATSSIKENKINEIKDICILW